MAGNPSNWWSIHSNLKQTQVIPTTTNLLMSQTHPSNSLLPLQFLHGGSSSSSSSSSSLLPFLSSSEHHGQDFPHSWSQLLMGGLASEQEERFSPSEYETTRVLSGGVQVDVKQELRSQSNNNNNNNNNNLQLYRNHEFQEEQEVSNRAVATWAQIIPVSSPKSCITSLSSSNNHNNNNNNNNNSCNNNNNNNNNNNRNSNMLDFSTNKRSFQAESHQHADHATNSECNSTATTGGLPTKKPRAQSSSTPPLKVRKEKLGDRITALHQLVSPFGKTDTASVLLEAIGYIRFLQGQIEALSTPYLGTNNASAKNQHSIRHGERNCLFPDHPGQLLNDSCLKRRGGANQEDNKDASKDLKSRGLCLIPISCTQLVGNDNGADYWAQSLGGGF